MKETEDNYRFHVELPGVKPEDIMVSVEDGVRTLSGERRSYGQGMRSSGEPGSPTQERTRGRRAVKASQRWNRSCRPRRGGAR